MSANDTGECLVVAQYPEVTVWEMNQSLPIAGASPDHTRTELRLLAGGGPCVDGAPAAFPQCEPLRGDAEDLRNVVLWRDADQLASLLFSSGATDLTSEDITGRTTSGDAFHYRLWAVNYGQQAGTSPLYRIIDECAPEEQDMAGRRAKVLRSGDEPYVMLVSDGSRDLLIETRIGSTLGVSGALPDTRTGLMPAPAVEAALEWWMRIAAALPPAAALPLDM